MSQLGARFDAQATELWRVCDLGRSRRHRPRRRLAKGALSGGFHGGGALWFLGRSGLSPRRSTLGVLLRFAVDAMIAGRRLTHRLLGEFAAGVVTLTLCIPRVRTGRYGHGGSGSKAEGDSQGCDECGGFGHVKPLQRLREVRQRPSGRHVERGVNARGLLVVTERLERGAQVCAAAQSNADPITRLIEQARGRRAVGSGLKSCGEG